MKIRSLLAENLEKGGTELAEIWPKVASEIMSGGNPVRRKLGPST